MTPFFTRALAVSAAAWCAACFSPAFDDGAIQCGEAGCPPGMFCGADGFCREDPDPGPGTGDPGDPDDSGGGQLALAIGNDDGIQLYAVCGGQLRRVWSAGGSARQVAWGDIDADGLPDLALAEMNGAAQVYELAETRFEPSWIASDIRGSRGITLADFDGDGSDDVLVAHDDGPLQLYTTGGGGEPSLSWSTSVNRRNWEVCPGDYDGDGDPDLAVAIREGPDEIYRNVGGTLGRSWITSMSEQSESVKWGDVDGDGLLDLATGAEEARARIYRNLGDGVFAMLWESPHVEDTEAVAFADYDGDGRLDLSVGNWWQPARIYRNNGQAFTDVWSDDLGAHRDEGEQAESLAWADVDGDGDDDLFIGRHHEENMLFRNDGGQLVEVWESEDHAPTRSAVWHRWERPPGFTSICDW